MANKFGPRKIIVLAFSIGGLSALLACGENSANNTPIRKAKLTEQETKLSACASNQLSGEFSGKLKTVSGPEVTVCRVNALGKIENVTQRPLFGAIKRGGQIGLAQVVIVNVAAVDKDGATLKMTETEKSFAEKSTNHFLRHVCRPMLQGILQRSGLAADFIFRSAKPGRDEIARSVENSVDNFLRDVKEVDEIPFADSKISVSSASPTSNKSGKKPESVRSGMNEGMESSSATEYHSILDLILSPDRGLQIKDEVDPVVSGSIEISKGSKPSVGQRHFCSQLALRVAENFGLTTGRDCASRKNVSVVKDDTSSTLNKGTLNTGLLKPGLSVDDLDVVKLSSAELDSVLLPLCGLEKKK